MPIMATLSRKFYEKFGDEVTNELVTWLNAVDESYRHEFRVLFSAHFGQLHAEMDTLAAVLRREMDKLAADLRGDMMKMESRLNDRIARMENRLLAWTVVLWLGTMGTLIALIKL